MKNHYAVLVPRPHAPREPLRTFSEMAAEFGLSRYQLSAQIRLSPIKPPQPVLRHNTNVAHHSWYRPSEMRRWWREHLAATSQPTQKEAA